jgi:dephospho-CoA kinase
MGMELKHNSPTTFEHLLRHWGIALTGGIATGKSTVAGILRQKGFIVIDADILARQVVAAPDSPVLSSIVQAFGGGIVDASGNLDREKLRSIVFSDAAARAKLEGIMHPAIRNALHEELQKKGLDRRPQIFFYEAALIFETKAQKDFREVWATECPRAVQLERLQRQRGVPHGLAEKILAGQMDASAKASLANRVIDTSGTLKAVDESVERCVTLLQKAFAQEKPLQ